ncbi:MAG: hypothetical protein PHH85_09375 [Candidatus Methanoperedens sp.]|nr:hypothetical protein [Candidatus Methanoperedens sp.]
MRRKLNLAKGLWVGKVKVNSMITSNGNKIIKSERQAVENSGRKRYLMKYELDGIIAILSWLVEAYLCSYLLKWDNAKRKPYTGNRFVRFGEKGEVERPLLYSTIISK